MFNIRQLALAFAMGWVAGAPLCVQAASMPPAETANPRKGSFRCSFEGPIPATLRKSTNVQYAFQLPSEEFFVHVPENYDGKEAFGVLALIHPGDSPELPSGWEKVLAKHRLIFITAQKAGNQCQVPRRAGLTLAGILKLMEQYRIDRQRVYATGLSGGGRVAVRLAFFHPELISGALPCCGADFHEPIEKVHSNPKDDYGVFQVGPVSIAMARCKVRFALITGSNDTRHGNILDLYEGGFAKRKFMVKLLDRPGMGHALCDAEALDEALQFVEKKPVWMVAKSESQTDVLKVLEEGNDAEAVRKAALDAWQAEVDPDLQRYAAAFARSVAKTTGDIQKFDFMLAALDDPKLQTSRCSGTCNALTRKIAEDHRTLLQQNLNLRRRLE